MGGWNLLDLFVVVFAWLVFILEEIIPGMPTSLTSLRALRALKILRTGRSMPRMKAMVDDVLASIPLMANVLALLGFIFFIFGLAGTRFFGHGKLRQQCWVPSLTFFNHTAPGLIVARRAILGQSTDNSWSNQTTWASNGILCGGDVQCSSNEICHIFHPINASLGYNENPGDDFVSFDNIAIAFLTIFQCLSLEGWVDVMYATQDTVGWFAVFFFVPLIIIGALFVMQLTLAVVANNYHTPEEVIANSGVTNNGQDNTTQADATQANNVGGIPPLSLNDETAAVVVVVVAEDDQRKKCEEKEEEKEEEMRNKDGCDQPHSGDPELWDIDGSEMDWYGTYILGSHEWYIQTRAHDRYNETPPLPIAGMPLNEKAKTSGRAYMQQVQVAQAEVHPPTSPSLFASLTSPFSSPRRTKKQTKRKEPVTKFDHLKKKIRTIVTADWYQWAMLGIIMLNTTLLAIDHYPMAKTMDQALDDWGIPFTVIFTIEVFIKLWSMGYHDWKSGSFNQFDAVVVFLDWFGALLLAISGGSGGQNSALSSITVLRTLRLLRVFKLVDFWEEFRKSIQTVMRSIEDVLNFTVVLILIIFVAALLGMGIFGGRYKENGFEEVPRGNFNSLAWALITVFQVITGENWNEVMLTHMKIDAGLSVIFFVLLYSFGQFILLNIFLVILLENESNNESPTHDVSESEQSGMIDESDENILIPADDKDNARLDVERTLSLDSQERDQLNTSIMSQARGKWIKTPDKMKKRDSIQNENKNEEISAIVVHVSENDDNKTEMGSTMVSTDTENEQKQKQLSTLPSQTSKKRRKSISTATLLDKDIELTEVLGRTFTKHDLAGTNISMDTSGIMKDPQSLVRHKSIATLLDLSGMQKAKEEMSRRSKKRMSTVEGKDILLVGYSCNIFGPKNRIRLSVHDVVTSDMFEYCILVLIFVSSFLLVAETPDVVKGSDLDIGLFYTNVFFTVLFTIEIILKVIAFGFLWPEKGAYCRSGWNLLDITVVFFSLFGFAVEDSGMNFVKGFRAARALRPLRLIKRAPGLRRVVNTLIKSAPPMANRMLVCLLFLLIFGILGVQLFKGRLYYCESLTETDPDVYKYTMNKSTCLGLLQNETVHTAMRERAANITQVWIKGGGWKSHDTNRTWINHRQHFNNIGASMLTLFEVTSLEMWPEIFASTVDAPGSWDQHPIYMGDAMPSLFFIPVVLICSLLVANLFVAAVVETFADIMASEDGSYLVTPAQQAWADVMHIMIAEHPALPMEHRGSWLKIKISTIMESEIAELVVVGLITFNTLTMSMYYWSPIATPLWYSSMLEVFNFLFLWIFFFEAVLKVSF